MDKTHLQLKTLALLLVLIFGITLFERADVIVAYIESGQNTANIFNPVMTFLGIQTNNNSGKKGYESLQTYDPLDPLQNDGDKFFDEISDDPFSAGSIINTPAPVGNAQNTVIQTSAATTNTSLNNRTPTLTCVPNKIGGGEEVIVMWACRDSAHTATSTNINTGGDVIGATRVTPEEDTTYTIECVNNIEDVDNTSASCEVDVANPALAIIATPRSIGRGGTVTLSWQAKDVNSCLVTSDKHRSFEKRGEEGDALSPTLIENTTFTLTCEVITGAIEERSVSVGVN